MVRVKVWVRVREVGVRDRPNVVRVKVWVRVREGGVREVGVRDRPNVVSVFEERCEYSRPVICSRKARRVSFSEPRYGVKASPRVRR